MKILMLTIVLSFLTACTSQETQDAIARQEAAQKQEQFNFDLQKAKEWHEQQLWEAQKISIFLTIGTGIVLLGACAGISTFLLQAGLYAGQWIKTKSNLIYAGQDGQMPLVITRGNGYHIIRDPNQQLGETNFLQLPTYRDQITGLIGKPVEFKLLSPPETDKDTQKRIATQAQAIRLIRASVSNNEDKVTRRQAVKEVKERIPQELKSAMDDAITAEIRNPRAFEIIDQTGTILL